jgi:hypothetical protein
MDPYIQLIVLLLIPTLIIGMLAMVKYLFKGKKDKH